MKKIEELKNIFNNIPKREPEDWPLPIAKKDLRLLIAAAEQLIMQNNVDCEDKYEVFTLNIVNRLNEEI